jgi:cysteine desulfurase / selenocysteine lyase
MFNTKIKKMFPIFSNKKHIYFDNAATTHKPQVVIDSISNFYSSCNANVYRGLHGLSEGATEQYERAREIVAKYINADADELIFTSGTTEGINFVADAWGLQNIKAGDEILITQVEHHANLLPWQRLAKKTGAKLRFIKLDVDSYKLLTDEENLITSKTKLVAVTQYSNVLGPVWDGKSNQLENLIEKARAVGAKILLDAAQSVPHKKIDVKKLNVDFLAFSAHKMCGPTGIGALYIKKELHDSVEPYQVGGSIIHDATFENYTLREAPYKFEAGTPPIAQAIGFGQAIEFINKNINFDELQKHEVELCSYAIDELEKIDVVKVLGNKEWMRARGHLVSFVINGVHAHDIASFLDTKDIAVRAGHHCAQPLANLLKVDSSVRFSFYMYNEKSEIETAVKVLKEAIVFLRGK